MAKDILDAQNLLAEARHLLQCILMAGGALSGLEGNAIATTAMVAMEKVEQADAALEEVKKADLAATVARA